MIVDHIGIIVQDLNDTLTLFERLFGLKPTMIQEMPEVGLKIAHLKPENVDIELLQYTMQEESFGRKVMGSRSGLNHLCFRVNRVDDSVRSFETQGVKVKEGFPRQGSHGRVAFFEPETTDGILIELCEQEKE
jgi:methylmalonyl-CoA/ethylmalonyl-CoA epimerase